MSRGILAIMAGLLCALAGLRRASGLREEAVRLNRWVALLRHLSLLLQEGTMSIPEALSAAADGTKQPDQLLQSLARDVLDSPIQPLTKAYAMHSGPCPEQSALQRMFAGLGHGSKASRSLAVDQAAAEIRLLAEQAEAIAARDAKMWQTLGLIGGACLTLMLL